MPGRGNNQGGKGDRNNGNNVFQYTIDETVELEENGGRWYYLWDIEEDLFEASEYSLRAISRDESNMIRAYIIPKEEIEAFKNGENFWYEFVTSSERLKISENISVDPDDEDPFYHDGDYTLAITGKVSQQPAKVTVKFAERD